MNNATTPGGTCGGEGPTPDRGGCRMNTQRLMAREVVNRVAEARGLNRPWPQAAVEIPDWLAAEDVSAWGVVELGAMRVRLASKAEREQGGIWYTPPRVAGAMVNFSITPQLDRLATDPNPANVLQVLAYDPSCGAGVFLVEAARLIAERYAARLAQDAGVEHQAWMAKWVMPQVLRESVFGIDRDPVAVDLAISVLWLEIDGAEAIDFMDRNVICGNPLAGDSPPALEERLRDGLVDLGQAP
jgi:hypothetical protein